MALELDEFHLEVVKFLMIGGGLGRGLGCAGFFSVFFGTRTHGTLLPLRGVNDRLPEIRSNDEPKIAKDFEGFC
jgi:hypothetical protein